jgi:Fic family protein
MLYSSGAMSEGTASREYLQSHPWISFASIDLQRAPHTLWMQLGEAASEIEHIAGAPLRPDVAKRLHSVYLAKGAHATTAIEGNSLSEEQVRELVERRLRLPRSQEYLGREVDNIIKAYNDITERLLGEEDERIHPDEVNRFNRLVLDGLNLDEDVVPGEYRRHRVVVARYLGSPAGDLEYLVDRLCTWLNSDDFETEDPDMRISCAIIKAIAAHVYLAWIHPYGDGNGRTARLLEYRVMVAAGVPIPAAHLLSSHYNLTRAEYYRQLDQASRNGGNLVPFLCYALQGYVDQLREQLQHVREQQLDVTWINYVHQLFDDRDSPTQTRRRHLVLDLSRQAEPVAWSRLSAVSPRVVEDYASRTRKTLTRDINELVKLELVKRTARGYLANKDIVFAYLPARRTRQAQPPEEQS